MENKYYTPTIEEFHVGFEFQERIEEYKVLSEPKQHTDKNTSITSWSYEVEKIKDVWVDKVYELDYFLNASELDNEKIQFDSIDPNLIRVKYLDKEDIESLGWSHIEDRGMSENNGFMFNKKDPRFQKSNFTMRYWVSTFSYRLRIENVVGCIFDGFIKNKSELKQLLKQLRITD